MSPKPHRIAVLAVPSVVLFDLSVACQVFGYPRPDLGEIRYRLTLCAPKKGKLMTSSGFTINVPNGLEALRQADTIVVPGIDDLDLPISKAVVDALAAAHDRGARVLSICTGAFVLAAAGLLEGLRATTHWMDAPLLASRYPGVEVDPHVLYVDNGTVLTSAGIAAGIDMCLYVVRRDFGVAVANAVARRMVFAPHRSGDQAQFVDRPIGNEGGEELEKTRSWIVERLAEPVTVDAMAAHARMSRRTFARRFAAETGLPPLQWVLRQRITAAQQLLEETGHSVERIAADCGFGSPASLRVHFHRALRTSPVGYRSAFRRRGEGGIAGA